jgi:hypothetical protein
MSYRKRAQYPGELRTMRFGNRSFISNINSICSDLSRLRMKEDPLGNLVKERCSLHLLTI